MRRGFTLVELLVVVVVMLMVTAVVVRATAPALAGRRQREAARMVDVFLSGARSRAMQTGRPVGVVFENGPSDPSACISLNYCETPPPYTGDYAASRIAMLGNGGFGDPVFPTLDTGWIGNVGPGDLLVVNGTYYQLFAGEPFIDLLPAGAPDGAYTGGEPFIDVDHSNGYTLPDATYIDSNGYFTLPGGVYPPAGSAKITYAYYDPAFQANTMSPSGVDSSGAQFTVSPAGNFAFKVVRRPTRQSGTSMQVPDGSCIDLSNSGVDLGLSSYQGIGQAVSSFTPPASFPLMVTFTPAGDVDRVWFNGVGRPPIAPLYFVVGKRELVPQSLTGQPQFTYQDLDSLWVRINPHGGKVGVSSCAPATGSTAQQQLYNSRRNARDVAEAGGR